MHLSLAQDSVGRLDYENVTYIRISLGLARNSLDRELMSSERYILMHIFNVGHSKTVLKMEISLKEGYCV